MVGDEKYTSVSECAENFVKIKSTIHPQPEIVERYEKQYAKYKEIYPSVKELFKKIK